MRGVLRARVEKSRPMREVVVRVMKCQMYSMLKNLGTTV